jgi:hypothetical protein
MGTSEAGFAAAWQLAIALDGAPQIVTEESGQWRVEVTLRLPFTSTADPDSSSSPEA